MPIFQAYFLFNLITIAATCVLRSVDNIVDYYKLYSTLCVALAITIIALSLTKSHRITYIFTVFSAFFYGYSYYIYTNEIVQRKNAVVSDMINWEFNPQNLRSLAAFGRFDAEFRIRLLKNVFKKGIYHIPENYLLQKVEEDPKNEVKLQINESKDFYEIENLDFQTNDGVTNWQTFIGFKNANNQWNIQPTQPIYKGIRYFLPSDSGRKMGLKFEIYKPYLQSLLQQGKFQLYICHFRNHVVYAVPAKQVLKI